VDFVASGSRFKLLLPKENKKITFVLAGKCLLRRAIAVSESKRRLGVRSPRTARNANEKSEPYGPEAQRFTSARYLQRDVEIGKALVTASFSPIN
jgi:staphylococcal nuclease domain-containing protein 1